LKLHDVFLFDALVLEKLIFSSKKSKIAEKQQLALVAELIG